MHRLYNWFMIWFEDHVTMRPTKAQRDRLIASLEEAMEDVKAGRVVSLEDLRKEQQ